ncbi:lipolytic enzyme, GDSL [Renibacterium salmoninarum ATCC 33209]|uniref:Lipolytic enzyme, GDSL n=1 Tax=Renibacterium salmoninarum (strain ATCC 33209 / DSM 20767 / JCM 11484 / NBRC 15589 / NCIMB 2235) TaxID=288705 RepID=A9WPA1_RENSM|nr:SGNH/GDSL hydrolase family protein [Renibacterium salmoninarum]ABY22906.1 lipolytic enzyme, GDSL [Renibacterium salmoninarum ATCC 33209]
MQSTVYRKPHGTAGHERYWRVGAVVFTCVTALGVIAPFEANATSPVVKPGKVIFKSFSTSLAPFSQTAVLIGDSQSDGAAGVPGADTWVQQALRSLNYRVAFCGRGGTGFVASKAKASNYPEALETGQWALSLPPSLQSPSLGRGLVVIQGGGNDARIGASDAQITANADRLLADLKKLYPQAQIIMIGTLGRGLNDNGGRRSQIDALLGRVAASRQLPFISVGDWLTKYKVSNKLVDGVHLNPSGHGILAIALRERLLALVGPNAE